MSDTSALILSGSIGQGHSSVAEACQATLGRLSVSSETVDCMRLLGGGASRAGMAAFRRLLAVPSVYDAFHFSHLRTGTWIPRAMERASDRRLVPELRARLGGRTLLLPVFPTGVSAAAALKAETSSPISVAVFCTDACAHRMWVHPGVDVYIVCSELAALSVLRYDAHASVAIVPPPVRPGFFDAPGRAAAREALAIPADASCVLVMGGGWGLGPLVESAEALVDAGYWVLAVAGKNRHVERRLHAAARARPHLRAFGFTDRVPALMSAADTVVTSPGQTCHEARVMGKWLVLLDTVPGHGRENALHELETGGALSCSPDAGAVTAAVRVMFQECPELPPWPIRSAEDWDKHLVGALAGAGIEIPERPGARGGGQVPDVPATRPFRVRPER